MRLFVGIELPDPIRQAAASTADELRHRLSRVAPHVTLRWVQPENLHVTLWFLGEVAETRGQEVATVLRAPFQTASFPLRIGGVGAFPGSGPPRALWLGIPAGGGPLGALHGELGVRFASLGFAPEKRAYSAHLTIARFKDVPRADTRVVRGVVGESAADIGECQVSGVTLFRSRLSPRGSQYENLLRVPLA